MTTAHLKTTPKYKSIILKLSGEALAKPGFAQTIDFGVVDYLIGEIKELLVAKVQLGIVIGGGNIFRGAFLREVDRVTGDQMGMLATMINALALRDAFLKAEIPVKVLSALPVSGIFEAYDRVLALEYLAQGYVLIFAGGTGNPLVTTDSALSLRGIELGADLLLKATNVDGVYTEDPKLNKHAKFYNHLSYNEVLQKGLAVMDQASFCLCREFNMQLRVYNLNQKGALLKIAFGEAIGTLVSNT